MPNLNTLQVRDLGHMPYEDAWTLQRCVQRQLMEGAGQDSLLLCEHPSVITLGRRGSRSNILAEEEELARRATAVLEIERGGDITWHGPGQLVCYPLLDLNHRRRDVHWYVRSLEEVVIETLKVFGLQGVRSPGRSGVWVGEDKLRKISSLGVRISRWCTLHGFSINVLDCREGFSLIRPCGLEGVEVTSMQEELQRQGSRNCISVKETAAVVVERFKAVFDYK